MGFKLAKLIAIEWGRACRLSFASEVQTKDQKLKCPKGRDLLLRSS